MAAGWNVRVTTFDSKGKPGIVRNFLVYEADKERAIELVRKRVPVHEGQLAEAVAEVGADELIGERMRPGDGKAAWLDIPGFSAIQPSRQARCP
jgi:hypothetical protein